MKDYVYYVQEGEYMHEEAFPNEEAAEQYAEKMGMEEYFVVEWEVD